MNDLRVALIVLGAVFLAVLLLWERRRATRNSRPLAPPPEASAIASTPVARPRRVEPSIDDFSPGDDDPDESLEVPTIHPVEPVRVEVMREVAVDVPAAVMTGARPTVVAPPPVEQSAAEPEPPSSSPVTLSPPIQWPPARTERVLTMRIVRGDGQALAGRTVRHALEGAGMVHGPQRIYHRVDADGVVRASAANLVRPGNLDPAQMDAQEFRGLSLFCILPGPVPATQMLDDLLQLARSMAGRIGAVVQDEQGAVLEGERLAQLRRSLAKPADGAPA